MQKYQNNITSRNGDVVAGAAVLITPTGGTSPSTIYAADGAVLAPNPMTTDANGYFEFYAADGRYDIYVNGQVTYTDVLIADSLNLTYTDPLTPTDPKTLGELLNGEEVSLMRFIPESLQAGIYAQTDNTDHTAYFQAAVDAVSAQGRGSLFVPAGRYNLNQITLFAGMKVRGAGPTTVFKPTGVFGASVMLYATAADDLELGNFSIDADRALYPALNLVYINASDRVYLHDITIPRAGGVGVTTANCANSLVERVKVSEAQTMGIYHNTGTNVLTRSCTVDGVYTSHGIHLLSGADCIVTDCCTSRIQQFGLNFYGMLRSKVVNHISYDSKLEGINFLNANYCDIENPTVYWTGDVSWASADFGISMWGDTTDPIGGNTCTFNRLMGGAVNNSYKSGVALADSCKLVSVRGVTVTNPNSANEAQGAGVLLYGSAATNNVVENVITWANNGFMRYGVYEFNAGGAPSVNRFANVNSTGHTIAAVTAVASSQYVTAPLTGTLATLAGTETLTNKTISGPSATMTGAVSGAGLAATGPGGAGTISATGAITGASVNATGAIAGNTVNAVTTVFGATVGASGAVSGATVTASGALAGASVSATGPGGAGTISATGAITGASAAVTGALTSSGATAGIGYATGAGGTVTQATSKTTGVTLNKVCGVITTNTASLAADAIASFVVTNSAVGANDTIVLTQGSGGTADAYWLFPNKVAAGSFRVSVYNVSAGALAEAVTINFAVIKGVIA